MLSRKAMICLGLCCALGLSLVLYGVVSTFEIRKEWSRSFYVNLYEELKSLGYRFVQARDYEPNMTGKIAVIVHDVDNFWSGASVLVSVEEQFGIRSTFFLRPDAIYFNASIPFFQNLTKYGWEVGFHYDCLSQKKGNQTAAVLLFEQQLVFMKQYFDVVSTKFHGDLADLSISNGWLWGNHTALWQELGLRDFSVGIGVIANWTYVSDANFQWHPPQVLGEHVLIDLHADWA